MNIAVFEDNDSDYLMLVEKIHKFFEDKEKDIEYVIHRYINQEKIYIDVYNIDLIFLDIESNNCSIGIDIGIKIKEMKNDILIVFVSNYSQYLIQGYKAQANRYLFKTMSQLEFNTEMEAVFKKYIFRYSNIYDPKICLEKIYFSEIMYIEFVARKSNLHFQNGKNLRTYYQLKDWMEILPSQYFGKVYRSIIINYMYVSGFKDNNIILSNNEKIPLSKTHKKEFEENYLKFIHWRI